MSKILLVSGSYPPDVCGVGDYSYNLINANPAKWEIYTSSDWRLRSLLTLFPQHN